ncbi:MAG: UbiA family prenyltransferase [Bacteroidales bacterium]
MTRFLVSLAVTFSAFTAMILAAGDIQTAMIWPVAGIFLLASGASAFNQYQEWPYDERMARTRRRPIPSRRISPAEGLRIAMICIVGGVVILMYESNWVCFSLGVINLIWYNGLYTWLKRKTAFAVVPGAFTGVIPILMGWSAMGGALMDPRILFFGFFLFIWQMPHFWMLTLKYGHEYRNAGFPVLNDLFSDLWIKVIVMIWMIASSGASIMFVFFRIVQHPAIGYGILTINIATLIVVGYQLFLASPMRFRLIFIAANLFMLLVMIALIADRMIIS